jgi:hypothetical protein
VLRQGYRGHGGKEEASNSGVDVDFLHLLSLSILL